MGRVDAALFQTIFFDKLFPDTRQLHQMLLWTFSEEGRPDTFRTGPFLIHYVHFSWMSDDGLFLPLRCILMEHNHLINGLFYFKSGVSRWNSHLIHSQNFPKSVLTEQVKTNKRTKEMTTWTLKYLETQVV